MGTTNRFQRQPVLARRHISLWKLLLLFVALILIYQLNSNDHFEARWWRQWKDPNQKKHSQDSITVSAPVNGLSSAKRNHKHISASERNVSYIQSWRQFALDHGCDVDVDYSSVTRQLDPFREHGIDNNLLQEARRLLPSYTTKVIFRNGRMLGNAFGYYPLLRDVARLMPNCTILINTMDEPRVLVDKCGSDNASQQRPESVFKGYDFSIHDAMKATCMDEKQLEYLERHHGFFQNPESFQATYKAVPIFSPATIDSVFLDILLPAHLFQDTWDASRDGDMPWGKKKASLFWRGSTTGGMAADDWISSHRLRLVGKYGNKTRMANGAVEADISLHDAIQCAGFCPRIRERFAPTVRVPFESHFRHKYLLDIDGNSYSRRLLSFHRSISLVFRAGIFSVWFSSWLKPWEHYIPLKLDWSDVEEKVEWAYMHDGEAKRIGERSSKFAVRYLRDVDMQCYAARVMLEYGSLWRE